ncbi:phosphatase PAP2 family protein [Peribacillus alkalitolerans]|uniref:phosphatase PAP2 family protein n=1 Tax=Peribacillus alkalitolerans TaxID=1550385 RepID=UPI0013D3C403|nr:phosphatase PAP2 family protein [Peribacillus alkalitolerans]
MGKKLKRKRIQYGIFIISLLSIYSIVFFNLVDELRENELEQFDSMIINFIQSHVSERLTILMKFFSYLGSVKWIIAIVLIVSIILVITRKSRYASYLIISSGIGALFNLALKWLFHRERPDIFPIIIEQGFSFPSGHSMGSFILYVSLAVVLSKISRYYILEVVIGIVFGFLVVSIGISRIYLGVHYPSDVIAGFSAGGLWVTICGLALNYYEIRTKQYVPYYERKMRVKK